MVYKEVFNRDLEPGDIILFPRSDSSSAAKLIPSIFVEHIEGDTQFSNGYNNNRYKKLSLELTRDWRTGTFSFIPKITSGSADICKLEWSYLTEEQQEMYKQSRVYLKTKV